MNEEKTECAQEDIKASLLNGLSDQEKQEWEMKLEQWQKLFLKYQQSDFYAGWGIKEFLKWIKFIEITKSNKEQVKINLEAKIKEIRNSRKVSLEGLSLQKIENYFNALKKLLELKNELKFNLDMLSGNNIDPKEHFKLIPVLMYAEKYPNPNVLEIKRFARFFQNITRLYFFNYFSVVDAILITNLFLEKEFTDIANITDFAAGFKDILPDEEVAKLSIYKQSPEDLRKEIENAFWEAEDYKFCDGEISLIWDCINFDKSDISTFDTQKLSDFKDCFNNFKTLFDNPTDLVRRALLTKGDYKISLGFGSSTHLQQNAYSFINEEHQWKEQLSLRNEKIELYKSLIKDFGDRKKTNNTLTTDDILNKIIADFLHNKTEKDWIYYFVKEESLLENCKEKKIYWHDGIENPSSKSSDFLSYLKFVTRIREKNEAVAEELQRKLNYYKDFRKKIDKLWEILTKAIARNGIKIEFAQEFAEEIKELSKICDRFEGKLEKKPKSEIKWIEPTKVTRKTRLKFVDILLIILGIACTALILVPIPTTLLDILLASTIGFALMLLIISIVKSKLPDFAFYPSLLFMVTIFRFSLNIASTRLILADGYAGQVIQTFGTYATSDNIIIGTIMFLVFVIIQFVVIAKSSTSIPKVAARFALDVKPFRQMAIDAELNAKRITEEEARERREEIRREADFYVAMDGASKFVKINAIAELIIIGINIAGGFIIGPIEKYTVLTIGSGLANQIPALLLSISSSIIIVSSKFKK